MFWKGKCRLLKKCWKIIRGVIYNFKLVNGNFLVLIFIRFVFKFLFCFFGWIVWVLINNVFMVLVVLKICYEFF